MESWWTEAGLPWSHNNHKLPCTIMIDYLEVDEHVRTRRKTAMSSYRDIQAKCSELRKDCLKKRYIKRTKPFPLRVSAKKLKQYYIELNTIWTKGERNHHTESKTRYTEGERKENISSIAQIWQNSDMTKHMVTFSSCGDLHNLGTSMMVLDLDTV